MELHKRYTYTMPQGAISMSGIEDILRLINHQRPDSGEWLALNPNWGRFYLPALPDEWDYRWLVSSGEYRGKFTTRVSQFYFKQLGIKCPAAFLKELGDLARAHTADAETYEFEFVDSFDWDAGDYGDENSCLWYDRAGGRLMLKENGGLAMLFYGGRWQEGLGRAFLAPIENDAHIVFNGYGFPGDETLVIARIFASFRNLPYKRITLMNNGRTSGQLWINSDRGYVVGSQAVIASMTRYDLRWPELYTYACYTCGTMLDEDDTYRGADDQEYCQSCFYEQFSYCDRCGEPVYQDDTHPTHDDQWLCRWCLDRHYEQCGECGDYFPANIIVQIEDTPYCRDCAVERRESQPKK